MKMETAGQTHCRPSNVWAIDASLCLLAVVCVTAWYSWQFLDLFPLAEYRSWISSPFCWTDLVMVGRHMLVQDNPGFSRWLAMGYAQVSGFLAGTNTYFLNALELLLLPPSCLLAYVLCRRLSMRPFASLAVVLLWAFSLPVLDAIAWQATLLDRLALLFCLLSLNLALTILRPLRRRSAQAAAVLGLTVCVIAAYNSKEVAFFLMPSILLLILLAGADTWIGKSKQLALVAIPLFYVAFHNLCILNFLLHANDLTHNLGGSLAINGRLGLLHCLGSAEFFKIAEAGIFSAIAIAATLGGLATWFLQGAHSPPDVRRRFGLSLWLWMSFGMAFAITLKTQYQPPFYQYLPRFLLVLAVVQGLSLLWEIPWRGERTARWVGYAALALVLCCNGYRFFANATGPYQERTQLARHFATSLSEAHQQVNLLRQDRIELVIPLPYWQVYLFFEGSSPGGLLRLVTPEGDAADAGHLPTIHNVCGVDPQRWQPSDRGTCYVCFTDRMTLDSVYCGGARRTPIARRDTQVIRR